MTPDKLQHSASTSKEVKRFYDELLTHSFTATAIVNQDGTIRYKSPSVKHLFGYDPADLIGKTAASNIYPEDIPRLEEVIEEAMQRPGQPIHCEFKYRHKTKGYLQVEAQVINLFQEPMIQGMVIHYRDNTTLYAMNEALMESREHLDLALQGAQLGIWDWNIRNQSIFYNKEWGIMLGYDPSEIRLEEDFWEGLIHPDDKAVALQKLEDHLAGKTSRYEAEYRLRTRTGQYRWILDRGQVLERDEEGHAVRAAGIHQDIHHRKSVQQSLQERTEELKRMNLELEQFAYITSHDVRAPMSNLVGLVQLIDLNKGDSTDNVQILKMIRSSILDLQKSLDNVDKILTGTGLTEEEPRKLRLQRVFEQVIKGFTTEIKEVNATIDYDFSAAPSITYPYSHIQSCFVNLLSNAIKYRSSDRKLVIAVKSFTTNEGVNIMVQDNGIGIDLTQYGDRIFQIHERFHAKEYGKGLGLFMLRKQLNYMGGQITVESMPDKGTTFMLQLKEQKPDSI